jgi:hypothetical protein
MTKRLFKDRFQDYACFGDTIAGEAEGYQLSARLVPDDCADPPDARQSGFWPSRDPQDPGYIGAKSESTFYRRLARARAIMDAWKRDGWHYCGVVVTASRAGVELGETTFWGLEMNYPSGRKNPNRYLDTVAEGLAPLALADAKRTLARAVGVFDLPASDGAVDAGKVAA